MKKYFDEKTRTIAVKANETFLIGLPRPKNEPRQYRWMPARDTAAALSCEYHALRQDVRRGQPLSSGARVPCHKIFAVTARIEGTHTLRFEKIWGFGGGKTGQSVSFKIEAKP